MKISLIVPCYNEGAVIERTAKAIVDTCTGRAFDFEIIFVNDGSKDDTLAFLKKLAGRSEKIKYISFSRNFGKEAAMLSGLEHCKGSCAVYGRGLCHYYGCGSAASAGADRADVREISGGI